MIEEGAKGPKTSSLNIPKELPTIEEALKILASALKASTQAGLDKVEVQRLQTVATLARTYKDFFADYVDYRGIEIELVELKAKYEDLVDRSIKPGPRITEGGLTGFLFFLEVSLCICN